MPELSGVDFVEKNKNIYQAPAFASGKAGNVVNKIVRQLYVTYTWQVRTKEIWRIKQTVMKHQCRNKKGSLFI
jgi:hypothetical protein